MIDSFNFLTRFKILFCCRFSNFEKSILYSNFDTRPCVVVRVQVYVVQVIITSAFFMSFE